ncbi:unnamed protein product [Gadus morhua 'NCC']
MLVMNVLVLLLFLIRLSCISSLLPSSLCSLMQSEHRDDGLPSLNACTRIKETTRRHARDGPRCTGEETSLRNSLLRLFCRGRRAVCLYGRKHVSPAENPEHSCLREGSDLAVIGPAGVGVGDTHTVLVVEVLLNPYWSLRPPVIAHLGG